MRPLEDITIIAVEQYGAGPFGSLQLADLGADVIKIEDPRTGGDIGRYVPPYQTGEDSLFFETFNRNKRSLSIDLTSPAGRSVFHALVEKSDAVYSNLRGDVPAKLGICYEDLKAVNPRIVCCSISGFGIESSLQKEPGYDYILQGVAGWMSLTGEPDGPPAKTGGSLVDYSAGYVAAIAMLSGIHAARRDGVGMDCDISLFDTAISLLTYQATWYLTEGEVPTRSARSAHPSLVPFQNFPTADGWIVVGCAKEKFWLRLVEALGLPELADDVRFQNFDSRRRHQKELIDLVDGVMTSKPAEYWLDLLRQVGVPCGAILDMPDALSQPLVRERRLIIQTEHPAFGTVSQLASPIRVGPPSENHRRAPQRNEHAVEILASLGYDEAKIQELTAAGAFG